MKNRNKLPIGALNLKTTQVQMNFEQSITTVALYLENGHTC